jgi:hypothetical protein
MMKALLCAGLAFAVWASNPGTASSYHPSMREGEFQGATYDCSSPCNSCDSYDDGCDEPCSRPCGPCGRGTCCDRTPCGPLTFLFSIFNCNTWRGPSCGERYWGDFYSDPPECHDPCDTCGNYVGGSAYRNYSGSVGGYGSNPTGGGCKNCNKNRVFDDQPIPEQGRVLYPSTRVSRLPTPSKQSTRSTRYQ